MMTFQRRASSCRKEFKKNELKLNRKKGKGNGQKHVKQNTKKTTWLAHMAGYRVVKEEDKHGPKKLKLKEKEWKPVTIK